MSNISVNSFGLSIIILSYNSKTDLERLFLSLKESEGVEFALQETPPSPPLLRGGEGDKTLPMGSRDGVYTAEVIVVDNGSTDGTADWLEELLYNPTFNLSRHPSGEGKFVLLRNSNTGFAHGNNLGLKKAAGEYVLFLNPDTKVEKNTLKEMLDFIVEKPEIGIATCKVVLPDGKLDLACRRNFPNPWNALARFLRVDKLFAPHPTPPHEGEGIRETQVSGVGYNMLGVDENQSMEIDSCMGAFMLVRRSVLVESQKFIQNLSAPPFPGKSGTHSSFGEGDSVKAFDEDFFMYGEDLDLCWRCKEAGFKVWYYPEVSITHFKGSSSRKIPFRALKWFHDAMWIFYQKHYSKKYFFLFNSFVFLGIYSRLVLLTVINFFKTNPKVSG